MAIKELNLAALMEDLHGGRVAAAFQAELRRCANDCDDRPDDDKPRVVTLQLKLWPIMEDGHLESIRGKFFCASKVPERRTKEFSFGFRNGGALIFDDLSPDNVNQTTFDMDDDDEGE